MENASKALIIAGAILISIVLVSVGVLVVNQLNPDRAISSMDEQQIAMFNSKFENSCGDNKSGTTVKNLLSTISTNNSQTDEESEKIKVNCTISVNGFTSGTNDSNQITILRGKINNANRYNVTPKKSSSGQITEITIEQRANP